MWSFLASLVSIYLSIKSYFQSKDTEAANFRDIVNASTSGDDVLVNMKDEFKKQDQELENNQASENMIQSEAKGLK